MYCVLSKKDTPSFSFVFGETHMKAKPKNMALRVKSTNVIKDYFADKYRNIPVFIAGDYNEEPQNEPISKIMKENFVDLYTIKQKQEDVDQFTNGPEHPEFTTFKFRENEGWVKRTIDYIFMA